MTTNSVVLNRLVESFTHLDNAISQARATIARQPNVPQNTLKRIESYEEILLKQRSLATAMMGHANAGNWAEVDRHIRIINALSTMIRDDAREVLNAIRDNSSTDTPQPEALL